MNRAKHFFWLFIMSIILTLFMGGFNYYSGRSSSSFLSACVGMYPAAVIVSCIGDYDRLSRNHKKGIRLF